jgi:MFS superfamily sulfate permease-like transporter
VKYWIDEKVRCPSSNRSNQEQSRLVFRSFANYDVAFFPQDLAAGLTLGAITISHQMATARLAGMPLEIGTLHFWDPLPHAFGARRFLSCGGGSDDYAPDV